MRVIAEPLAEKGFAPFGEELTIPASGRTFFDGALANLARAPRLSPVRTEEFSLPLARWRLGRHAFSSQRFVPCRPPSPSQVRWRRGDEELDPADHHPCAVTGDAHGRL